MSSLDLSDFFNNDDSDGHRLAEFLQKRRGGVQRPNLLYLNYETQRKSLHVQLEKLPEKIEQQLSHENGGINNQNEENISTVEKDLALIHGERLPSPSLRSEAIVCPSNESFTPVLPVKPSSPPCSVRPLSPLSPSGCKSLSKPSRPLSPRLSAIVKSGGIVSPADKLRRLSLKRLTKKLHGVVGRRTLLDEFERTVNDANFEPPVCSTPLSQPIIFPSLPTTTCSPGGCENLVPNSSDSCCGHTDTLMKTLERQDKELKEYIKNIQHEKDSNKSPDRLSKSQSPLQNTKSTLKRTYTLEKGQSPGQVILTPDRSTAEQCPPEIKQPFNKVARTADRSLNRSMISIRVESPRTNCISPQPLSQSLRKGEESPKRNLTRSAIMVNKSLSTKQLNCSLPNTPPRNVSIVFPSQDVMDVEIPETQEVPLAENENCIMIQSKDNTHMPVVVIPINQNFNPSNAEYQKNNNHSLITAKPKSPENNSRNPPLLTNTAECVSKPEDNLKLTDILTDDDDDYTPKAATNSVKNDHINNNSLAPLNLAPTATNLRTKRLRTRSLSRRRLQMDCSHLLSSEAEAEPPAAHSNNASQRKRTLRRKIPLNRAPGTPLNGERFALELNRMSNYEIIDLRKRNSMGRVFAISGRKSSRLLEQANKKQLQLDDEIEMELLRRNREESTNKPKDIPTNGQNNTQGDIPEDFIPVPQEFQDESHLQEENHQLESSLVAESHLQKGNHQLESSLVDEKSTDRVSFKTTRRTLKNSYRHSVKPVTKELQQYLEISKILNKKKKRRKSKMDQSKRSLYTQGNSDTEETNADSSAEKLEIDQLTNKTPNKQSSDKTVNIEMETLEDQSLPLVPSPPPPSETDHMPALRVVSPPPPLSISLRELQTDEVAQTEDDEPLPPPPPEFDTDSDGSSKPSTKQHSPMANIDKDEYIFKKPFTPPPPINKKVGKPKGKKNGDLLLNDMHATQDTSADSSLRRSKRQVSAVHPIPIFQVLYQQVFNRCLYISEKNKARQKQKLKEMSKATLGDNSTINSIKSNDSKKSSQKPSTRTQRKKLSPVPEDEAMMTCLQNDKAILKNNKKTGTKKPSKAERKNNKNEQRIEENLECSEINLTTPPPVDNFNNLFDHIRDTSMAIEHAYTEATPPASNLPEQQQLSDKDISNCKKLRVRIKSNKPSKAVGKNNKNEQRIEDKIECSRINLTTPPPVDHFNNIFDHLRNTSMAIEHAYTETTSPASNLPEQQQLSNKDIYNCKKLRVRIKRITPSPILEDSKGTSKSTRSNTAKPVTNIKSTSNTNRVSSSSSLSAASASVSSVGSNQSNFELITWLRNITETDNITRNDVVFKEMRISSASNLSFTTIQGVEYAFYDTDDKACLGYLRFKPGQIKPKKKAKRFHLHFVTIVGQFRITANDKESRVGPGDMVAIEKKVYYDIENLTDDIGILMVVKK